MMMRALALSAAVASASCSGMAHDARVQIDQARRDHARTLDVARQAPVPYARFEAAQRAARQSTEGSQERATRSLEARLWLETAIADAELHTLSRQRLAEEQALVALDAQLLQRAQARSAGERARQLEAARSIVRGEVDKALARAAQRPAQRVKLSRDAARSAAEALLLRARLVTLTLAAFIPAGKTLAGVEAQLARAEALRERDPEASLTLADETLFRALALLGELRGSDAVPRPEEREALVEALRGSGLEVTREDRGLRATLAQAFRANALAPGSERTLARMCALALAHPHGRVQLSVQGARATPSDARVQLVRRRFVQAGCADARYAFQPAASSGDALDAIWLAY